MGAHHLPEGGRGQHTAVSSGSCRLLQDLRVPVNADV